MCYFTGETTNPPATEQTYKTWEAENSIVMACLINSMDAKIRKTYQFYNTAYEI